MLKDGCVFCSILKNMEFEPVGPNVATFTPLNPVVEGHRLFIPRTHVKDAAEQPYVTGVTFQAASEFGQAAAVPFNLITSAGSPATQTDFHLHVHYVPRLPGDGLHLPWTAHD